MASKGIDYSRFDKIVDSDDEEEQPARAQRPPHQQQPHALGASNLSPEAQRDLIKTNPEVAKQAGLIKQTKASKENTRRKQFYHNEQLIYEWEQSLDEVNIYISPPPGVTAAMFDIEIKSDHLIVGIKGNKERFLNHPTWGRCKHSESFWTLEDDELHITMTKLDKGVPWDAALQGHEPLDPLTQQEIRSDIMKERFQEEHPGFDFSNATFNGNVPDPSKFMGGVGYR